MVNKIKLPTIRQIRQWLSIALLTIAIFMFIPPFIPEPSDFLNLWFAKFLTAKISISLPLSLIISYTLLPLLILYISAVIHPRDTQDIFSKSTHKAKEILEKTFKLAFKNPLASIIVLLVVLLVYWKFLL